MIWDTRQTEWRSQTSSNGEQRHSLFFSFLSCNMRFRFVFLSFCCLFTDQTYLTVCFVKSTEIDCSYWCTDRWHTEREIRWKSILPNPFPPRDALACQMLFFCPFSTHSDAVGFRIGRFVWWETRRERAKLLLKRVTDGRSGGGHARSRFTTHTHSQTHKRSANIMLGRRGTCFLFFLLSLLPQNRLSRRRRRVATAAMPLPPSSSFLSSSSWFCCFATRQLVLIWMHCQRVNVCIGRSGRSVCVSGWCVLLREQQRLRGREVPDWLWDCRPKDWHTHPAQQQQTPHPLPPPLLLLTCAFATSCFRSPRLPFSSSAFSLHLLLPRDLKQQFFLWWDWLQNATRIINN